MPEFTDTFVSANRRLPGYNGWYTGYGREGGNNDLYIRSNAVTNVAADYAGWAFQTATDDAIDSSSSVAFNTAYYNSWLYMLLARGQFGVKTSLTCYAACFGYDYDPYSYQVYWLKLYRWNNGALALLGYQNIGATPVSGTLYFDVQGTTLTAWLSGYKSMIATATDASWTSGPGGLFARHQYDTTVGLLDDYSVTYTAPSGLLAAQRGGVSPLSTALVPGYMMEKFRRRRGGLFAPSGRLATC